MVSRILLQTARRRGLFLGLAAATLAAVGTGGDAHAQIAGTTNKPLPNVLLLVDSSGSMERMPDNSMPSANPASKCVPGAQTTPNRWGMLIQALTGNLQPYFSCDEINRGTPTFKNEFRIGGGAVNLPYDADYFLPYHRPLTGSGSGDACAFAPSTLPGAAPGSGLGPSGLGVNTGTYADASSFPPEAFQPYKEAYLRAQYGSGPLGTGLSPTTANLCNFDQANDGQLDAARDYVRFGLMMFDNDPSAATGVTGSDPLGGSIVTGNPFLGQWSYAATPAVNPFSAVLGKGRPLGCGITSDFEVGARHWAAPPWEGRMIRFPNPDGTLYDIQRNNEQIQQVLLGTRPYGATPIDGMIEDARDYLWYNPYGPLGTQAGFKDLYADAGCRDQYIILLTDGAPNLDLRPSCEPGTLPGSQCPYPSKAAQVADQLSNAPEAKKRVKTFVIGFSVNGAGNTTFTNDGFPVGLSAPNNNCKYWYNQVTSNGSNPDAMHTMCTTGPTKPAPGSTADACCQLSEIAYFGSGPAHDTPPFFAESQADLVLSFGRVLGGITKAATTRTLPAYSPAVNISGVGVTGDFIASFIPNAQKVWSGEIDRSRSVCVGSTPTPQAQTVGAGDSFAVNTAAQAGSRKFVSVQPTNPQNDASRTLRPWATTAADGINPGTTTATEVVQGTDMQLASSSTWADALNIDDKTCKRSRDISGTEIPALGKVDCTKVIWGFATASPVGGTYGGYSKWNVRCAGGGSATSGKCSVGGSACTLLGASCPIAGEVCVPDCSALGAIYRSTPQLVGPPTDLIRDDEYRAYADLRKTRRPAMFVATTDGVLHAFKALSSTWGNGVSAFDNFPSQHELWSFIPPAVLPKLASNYPTGQQILLDGTPAIKDIVWDRARTADKPAYHTTLVSGMGAGGGGYYALNISDYDCQGGSPTGVAANPRACLDGQISPAASLTAVMAKEATGPQFLWQLTDVESLGVGETAKVTRTKASTDYVALFGKESGNAAITTVLANPDNTVTRQIGIAILPGGIDGPPVQNEFCARALNGGSSFSFPAGTYDASDTALTPRQNVRKWAAGNCLTAPVAGRSLTVVRADTGEILRVFGRPNQDIPKRLTARFTPAPFDSPIIGTPAVYPAGVGVVAQKAFVGDADGTVWRLELTDPNPANWRVVLFQDLYSKDSIGTPSWQHSQPIQIPLTLTQDPFGGIMIAAATGDQESIVASAGERNVLMTIQEQKALSSTQAGRAVVRWYQQFSNAARVTGPMTVFDRTLYFATYQPAVPNASACGNGGTSLLWGLDYFNARGGNDANGRPLTASSGGDYRWCPIGNVNNVSGGCTTGFIPNENPVATYPDLAGAIIPGVTIRAAQSCAQFGAASSDPAVVGMSTTSFSLFFGATAKASSSTTGSPQAARPTSPLTRPLPRTAANIDSWAFIVD